MHYTLSCFTTHTRTLLSSFHELTNYLLKLTVKET